MCVRVWRTPVCNDQYRLLFDLEQKYSKGRISLSPQ